MDGVEHRVLKYARTAILGDRLSGQSRHSPSNFNLREDTQTEESAFNFWKRLHDRQTHYIQKPAKNDRPSHVIVASNHPSPRKTSISLTPNAAMHAVQIHIPFDLRLGRPTRCSPSHPAIIAEVSTRDGIAYSQHPTPPQPPILPVPIRPPTPLLIPLMMQRNRVKLLKRIRNLAPRRLQPRIQRHTLHLRRGNLPALILPHEKIAVVVVAQVDGLRFFHVAEVDGVDAAALVGDYGWFGVAEQGPGGAAEEGVGFYV